MSGRRVLLVVGTVAGGAGRHVHELAVGLSEQGWEVVVACPESVAERYAFADLALRVVLVEIGARPSPRADRAARRTLRAAAREVDIVHAHGVRAGVLAVLSAEHTPVAVTLHNAAPEGRAPQMVFGALARVVARRADVVLAVSPDLAAEAERLGAGDVRPAVVPSAPPVEPSRLSKDVRRALGDPAVLALTVARLAPQKDLHLLLDSMSRVDPDLGLLVVVAGDGPERDALQARIDHDGLPVRLLGTRDDVPDLLAAADLVVSSARWEGQPVWLQEAMHAGCPAVATDVGGTADVIGAGGVLVPHGDAVALATAVEQVAGDRDTRDRLAAQADSRGRTLPGRAAGVEAVEEVYRELIGRPPRPVRSR